MLLYFRFSSDEEHFHHLDERAEDEKSEKFDDNMVPYGFGMTSFDQAFDEVEGIVHPLIIRHG